MHTYENVSADLEAAEPVQQYTYRVERAVRSEGISYPLADRFLDHREDCVARPKFRRLLAENQPVKICP